MPPDLDALADEFHGYLNEKFKEAGQFSPYPGPWDSLPEVARIARRAAAEWAMGKMENGAAKETIEKYQAEHERMLLAVKEAQARAEKSEKEAEEALARATALEEQVQMPMEPLDLESLIPLTRDQETEAFVQQRAILDGTMRGSKALNAELKRMNVKMNGQTIFMAALGIGILYMFVGG